MGERRGDMATSEDRRALVQLLEEGLAAGAIGFSSSRGPNHVDAFGDPVPSRYADDVEIRELVRALQGKAWQINLEHKFNGSHEDVTEEVARYVAFSEGREALTWTPLLALRGDDSWRAILAHTKGLAADGAAVAPQVAPQPLVAALSFYGQASISRVAGWEAAFSGFGALDHASRIERLSDEGFRAQLRAVGYSGHASRGLHPSFDHWIIAGSPSRPDAVGAPVLGLVDDVPRHPVDAFLDLVVADDLKTFVQVPVLNTDSAAVAELVADPGTLIGLGDAGAHVNSIVNYTYTTYVLSEMVRERRWLTIESAVHRLTGQPARFLGITDRGMILPGQAADICIIDAAHLRLGSIELRHDLPGEAPRLFCDAAGYAAVLVNGVQTVADDGLVGAAPGRVLRA